MRFFFVRKERGFASVISCDFLKFLAKPSKIFRKDGNKSFLSLKITYFLLLGQSCKKISRNFILSFAKIFLTEKVPCIKAYESGPYSVRKLDFTPKPLC